MVGKLTASYQQKRKSAAQLCQDIKDQWDTVESSAERTPLPELHLLRDMGRSPGGTLFPWYLVKGLMTLRGDANNQGAHYTMKSIRARWSKERRQLIAGGRQTLTRYWQMTRFPFTRRGLQI